MVNCATGGAYAKPASAASNNPYLQQVAAHSRPFESLSDQMQQFRRTNSGQPD